MRVFRSSAVLALAGLAFCLTGSTCGTLDNGFIPPVDDSAICQTISPGSEITARIGFGGRPVKLGWSNSQCKLETRGNVEVLTLVAKNDLDGFVTGDTDGLFTLIISRDGGLAIANDYRDSKLVPVQQPGSFEVALSSSPHVNCIPIRNGGGSANVTVFQRSGNRITTRIGFTIRLLNLVNNTLNDVCGEAYFDGTVQVK